MDEKLELFIEEFRREIESGNIKSKKDIEFLKRRLAKKYGVEVPKNPKLVELIDDERLRKILAIKPVRSISGVNILTVVAPAFWCPGKCIYCPTFPNVPKSYTPNEPAIQRAIRNNYDSYKQTLDRLHQFKVMGHLDEGAKIEVIILGGTFLALDENFRYNFVKGIFDALNGKISSTLEEAHRLNENAKYRCVNLTIETRPDFCFEEHVDAMLSYGTTRVEIGVQTVYDDVLEFVKREHTVADVKKATRIARNAGLKITYHVMPNLPKSDLDRDLEMFRILFEGPDFRPDFLKIYPLQLFKNTTLYRLYEQGKFRLYTEEELIELLAKAKKFVPKYVRIQRLGRDIPLNDVDIAYPHTNLREYVRRKAAEMGIFCKCIRCREVGFRLKHGIIPDWNNVKMHRLDYEANDGLEIFLSFEDDKTNTIFGYLRLRIPEESHRPEINNKSSIVRELKVMGPEVPVGDMPEFFQVQHRGFGKQLMQEAERITKEEFNRNKVIVISAIGTRNYYRKLGYTREGPYMVKYLE
ncbi:MAG: tRNA uridine(34) 5-carboxymethylaminomethyl modification radical SAM/GNAT enzyme Elp3 [Candidatus Aenigmarchaeota archaeon]|nr:tRNA uridine(34) 5-carboxymethylaminomethyl modification radical SAM/GNAT enzyme Elp3 [Candidatus Aenigmarchaeota archaeon]